jgi:hypothetical protein
MIVKLLVVGKSIKNYIFTLKDLEKIRDNINEKDLIGEFGSPNINNLTKLISIDLTNAGVIYKNAYIKDDSLYCEAKFINVAESLIPEIGIENISFGISGLYNTTEENSFKLTTFDIISKTGIENDQDSIKET